MARNNRKIFKGVEQGQEVNIALRRDDPRSVWKRIGDSLSTPKGTVLYFGSIAAVVGIPAAVVPGAGEIGVLIAAGTLLMQYSFKNKAWRAPFRVPAYLGKLLKFRDTTTGKIGAGLIYMGREINTDREVWVTANDTRTHRLVAGTTGSGKTEEILGNIFNALVLDSGAMLVDGKSDPKTFNSLLQVCRVLGRDEDLLVMNYIMGGRDFADGMETRRSHTYNPLGSGSAAMKSELMVSLLDSGSGSGSDMWQGRAISFLEAICPPLSYLADRGLLLFNPQLLCEYFLLENIENLLWFGIFKDMNGNMVDLLDGSEERKRIYNTLVSKYCGNLRLYVENLPGYSAARPKKPHQPTSRTPEEWTAWLRETDSKWKNTGQASGGEEEGKKKQSAEQTRGKVLEQHGFITMQLVRATGNLTFNYGHIYNDEIGEINYRDILLNRRIELVMLPALERSKQTMEQLGKMAVSSIKGVLATLLDTPLEGNKREIIDGRPANAEIPYFITCDEYGYYVVPGFAVAPAQARSYGVSITFGTQSFTDLLKGNREEGEATWDNTNLRLCGRMTGGEESDTYKKFAGAAGKASVSVAQEMNYNYGSALDQFTVGRGSNLQQVCRIDADDLIQQMDGEFHMVVGAKSQMDGGMSKYGGSLIIRMLAFYTGNVPPLNRLALVHYVQVKAFSVKEREIVMRNAAVSKALALVGDTLQDKMMSNMQKVIDEDAQYVDKSRDKPLDVEEMAKHRRSILSVFVSRARVGNTTPVEGDPLFKEADPVSWNMSESDIDAWLDKYDALRKKQLDRLAKDRAQRARFGMIGEKTAEVAGQVYHDDLVRSAHEKLLTNIMAGWKERAERMAHEQSLTEERATELHKKVAEGKYLLNANAQ